MQIPIVQLEKTFEMKYTALYCPSFIENYNWDKKSIDKENLEYRNRFYIRINQRVDIIDILYKLWIPVTKNNSIVYWIWYLNLLCYNSHITKYDLMSLNLLQS